MMYRLQVITDDDQYEMWGHDQAEASERFRQEAGNPNVIFLYGTVPPWLTLAIWSRLRCLVANDDLAQKLAWALDACSDDA